MVVGSSSVIVGKPASFKKVLIGWKWARIWNAPGTKIIVGFMNSDSEEFMVSGPKGLVSPTPKQVRNDNGLR